jgi:glycosyltransferase involved in cell wall biosynthesis
MTICEQKSIKWPGWALLFRWAHEIPLREADTVIARGRRLAGIARRLNPTVHETIPIGHMIPSPQALSPVENGNSSRHILFVGRLIKEKGAGDLLKALKEIVETAPGLRPVVDIVGAGPERESLGAAAADHGIAELVVFHDWAGVDRLNALYHRADVVVVPSNGFPEGVPRVIDEALMRRVPVVATRVGGVPEEFDESEVCLVDPGKPGDLAGILWRMLLEPGFRDSFVRGAERRRQMWQAAGSAAQQHLKLLLED